MANRQTQKHGLHKKGVEKFGKYKSDAPPGQEITSKGAGKFLLYLLAGLVVFFLLVFAYIRLFPRHSVPPSMHPSSEPASHSALSLPATTVSS